MAHIHSVYDSDKHFEINPATRALINHTPEKVSLMQFDHDSERITFELPRTIEGHDMTTCNVVEVHYLNIDAKTKESNPGLYEVDDLQLSPAGDDVAICSWLVSSNATQLVGPLYFRVSFKCSSAGEVDYLWSTAIYKGLVVDEGINNGDSITAEYADILEQWRNSLQNGVDGEDGITPHIGDNGNWFIGETDTGKPSRGDPGATGADGQNGVTPHIGENGNWYIGDTDTGKPSRGQTGEPGADGQDGYTPVIGSNGNWWIGGVDTGKPSRGEDGVGDGGSGENGATFIPAVDANGNLSWSNDKGLENPATVNIMGPEGPQGQPGPQGEPGDDGPRGESGVYFGSGDPPEDANIWINPNGEEVDIIGGYYEPAVSQPEPGQMVISFSPSDPDMPAVANVAVTLPPGPQGETGPQGEAGPQGSAGSTGATGPQGQKGDPGKDGVRPNLLDNWYFGNPVNQRGQTSLATNASYFIDRWRIRNDGTYAVSIVDGGIRIPGGAAFTGIMQSIENGMTDLAGKTVTLSALVTTATGPYVLQMCDGTTSSDGGNSIGQTTFSGGGLKSVTLTLPDSFTNEYLNVFVGHLAGDSGTTLTPLAMKLELGDTQTLAHQDGDGNWVLNEIPNFGEQLARCQRYFVRMQGSSDSYNYLALGMGNAADKMYSTIYFPTAMRTVPVVSSNDVSGIYAYKPGTTIQGSSIGLQCWSVVPGGVVWVVVSLTCAKEVGEYVYRLRTISGIYIDFTADL